MAEKRTCGAGRKRAGFRADHADLITSWVRARGPDEWGGERRRAGIFQQIASSHEYLPEARFFDGIACEVQLRLSTPI